MSNLLAAYIAEKTGQLLFAVAIPPFSIYYVHIRHTIDIYCVDYAAEWLRSLVGTHAERLL